jgi:hypothetical protein
MISSTRAFFKVFSFPLLYGDPETALKEPYSLVLTEHRGRVVNLLENIDAKIADFVTL